MTRPYRKGKPWTSRKACKLCHYYLPIKWKRYHPECMRLITRGKKRIFEVNSIIWNVRRVGYVRSYSGKKTKVTSETADEDILEMLDDPYLIDEWTMYEPQKDGGFRYLGTDIEIWRNCNPGLKTAWGYSEKHDNRFIGLPSSLNRKHFSEAESARAQKEP